MTEKLGVDIGGVIIDRANDRTDTSFFGGNYLETTAVPGATPGPAVGHPTAEFAKQGHAPSVEGELPSVQATPPTAEGW